MSAELIDFKVALSATGEPPTEFRIFSKGKVKTRKGEFLFDDDAAKSVKAHASDFGAEYPLDYGHSHLGMALGDPADHHAAAGWFTPELRDGELWATSVTWTPKAEQKIRDREYRYISPAFNALKTDAGMRVTELLNVALTNIPATKGLTPLVLSTEQDETVGTSPRSKETASMATIELMAVAATVGASASASETEVLSRVAMHREVAADLIKLTGKDEAKALVGVVMAWRDQAAQAVALASELASIKAESLRKEVEAKVESKISEGHVLPAEKDHLVAMGMGNPATLDGYLSVRNVRIAGASGVKPARVSREKSIQVPDAKELKFLGVTAEAYLKTALEIAEEEGDG